MATIANGPITVNGRPRSHSDEARNESAKPWPSVVAMANHVHGSELHNSGVRIPANPSRRMPSAIPAMMGERISIT